MPVLGSYPIKQLFSFFSDLLHLPLKDSCWRLMGCPVGGILLTHCWYELVWGLVLFCFVLLKAFFLQNLNGLSQNWHMQKLFCCEDFYSRLTNLAFQSFKKSGFRNLNGRERRRNCFPSLIQGKFLREFTVGYMFPAPTEIT